MNAIATLFGLGNVKRGPGTAGSLAAAILAFGILQLSHGWLILIVGTVIASLVGTVAAQRYMDTHPELAHDPQQVIVDELAGQWLTYIVWYLWIVGITSRDISASMLEVDVSPQFLFIGFLLFRFFDILKPWPISWADRKIHGGFGVMFDDILAAFPAGSILYLIYLFWPMLGGQMESMP